VRSVPAGCSPTRPRWKAKEHWDLRNGGDSKKNETRWETRELSSDPKGGAGGKKEQIVILLI